MSELSSSLDINKNNSAEHIIRYWRHSLADKDRMGVMHTSNRLLISFGYKSLKSAKLPREEIQKLFIDAEEARKQLPETQPGAKANKSKNQSIETIQVLVSPFHVLKKHHHGMMHGSLNEGKRFYPLIIPAKLHRDGRLSLPENEILPWIDRRCLRPNSKSTKSPFLGNLSDSDAYYDENILYGNNELKWDKYFEYAIKLFNFVINSCSDNELSKGAYSTVPQGIITPYSDKRSISKSLLKTYEEFIEVPSKIPGLLKEFCLLDNNHECDGMDNGENLKRSHYHLGQIHNKYPLSESQRIALSHFSVQENNNIFTINGPPGTGKTTLLLSAIVSNWIQAIVDEKKYPPIIVSASTNNQAVLNILDHFNLAHDQNTTYRWLPDIESFGLYLVSSNENQIDYLHMKRGKAAGSIWQYINEEYTSRATEFYLKTFNEYFDRNERELNSCAVFLRNKIIHKSNKLKELTVFVSHYYSLMNNIKKKYISPAQLAVLHKKYKQEIEDLNVANCELNLKQKEWIHFKTHDLLILRFFKILPFFKKLIAERIRLYTMNYLDEIAFKEFSVSTIDEYFESTRAITDEKLSMTQEHFNNIDLVLNEYNAAVNRKSQIEKEFGTKWTAEQFTGLNENGFLAHLDKSLRYELFLLSTHYWEARWLLENTQMLSLKYTASQRKIFWSIQSMLTPCLVTTLHTGPSFFQCIEAGEFVTLTNFIDLLVIDEAGQTLPLIAAPLISIAKKLLLVGDVQQIEPIIELPQGIDCANATKYISGFLDIDYESLKESGILCSGDDYTMHSFGNLMTVGQRRSKFKLSNQKNAGLLLKEHRRCVDEIISYCNELAYDNQLVPKVGNRDFCFPPMGYAHIMGSEITKGSSRYNKIEADAIASWISKNQSKMIAHLKDNMIDQCIGIVTPFQAQASAIRFALKSHNLKNIKVGTIHSFQGGEFPIIIFSPVYSSEKGVDHFFFDLSISMLNVAVSRAKLSFLVFGDMNLFDERKSGLPSSLLAKFLFKSEQNEIKDIVPKLFDEKKNGTIKQLINLKEHQVFLNASFKLASEKLVIVSPYLTVSALEKDSILDLIREKAQDAIITVYTDPSLNTVRMDSFNQAKDLLLQAGAEVVFVKRVHTKLLAIDNKTICIGSFNWLSSSRDQRYKLDETSIVYNGDDAEQYIVKALSFQDKIYKRFSPIKGQVNSREKV